MIDWAVRRVKLEATENPTDNTRTVVTYAKGAPKMSEHAAEEMDGSFRTYTRRETLIRDCYDALLNRFDRFGGYLSMRLMAPKDMETYVRYYIDDVCTLSSDATEALWTVCLMTRFVQPLRGHASSKMVSDSTTQCRVWICNPTVIGMTCNKSKQGLL